MAGSRKWFVYTTDIGSNYALNADESNVEDLMGTNGDYTGTSGVQDALPRNIEPRKAVYSNPAGTRSITIPVLTANIYNNLTVDTPAIDDPLQTGQTLNLSRLEPERFKIIPQATDTGLNDGDAT